MISVRKMTNIVGLGMVAAWTLLVAMGEQTNSASKNPHTPLEPGKEVYTGMLKDEKVERKIKEINFSGDTGFDGLLEESTDSIIKIDLAMIRLIKIIDKAYASARYPDKQLAQIEIKFRGENGKDGVTRSYLAPRNIQLSWIDVETGSPEHGAVYLFDEIIIDQDSTKKEAALPDATVPVIIPNKQVAAPTVQQADVPNAHEKPGVVATEKNTFEEKQINIVEKKMVSPRQPSIGDALGGVVLAIIALFKAIFNFIRGLFS